MNKLTADQLKEILQNARVDAKGANVISDCPFCEKKEHFGVALEKLSKRGKPNPFRCLKCGEVGSLFKLLKKLNRLDLLGDRSVNVFSELEVKKLEIVNSLSEQDLEATDIRLPLGYKRIKQHDYLDSRGFSEDDYEAYEIGITKLGKKLQNYIIMPVREGGKVKGYVARSLLSKEEIDAYNKAAKQEGKAKLLRYKNSEGADFDRLLDGIDEVTDNTHTVFLVEGKFGKYNIDRLLQLGDTEQLKCLVTFGKSLSDVQIIKLARKKNVKNVIVLFDHDAVKDAKDGGLRLENYFNVLVGYFPNPEKDSGDVNEKELDEILENLEKPFIFGINKLNKNKLENEVSMRNTANSSISQLKKKNLF